MTDRRSPRYPSLYQVAEEIGRRLAGIFLRGADGRRPVYGGTEKFQADPHWRDLVLFYEYFHGDNGAGIGASHQTGWTGLIAGLLVFAGRLNADELLHSGLSTVESAPKAARRSSPAVRA